MFLSRISSIYTFIIILLVLFPLVINSSLTRSRPRKKVNCRTILVNQVRGGHFRTIQAAIDSVPSHNKDWTCILIQKGIYREQVHIPFNKPFIYLKGRGTRNTYVVWGAHGSIATSATFNSQADNIIAAGLTFINSYNSPVNKSIHNKNRVSQAVAARIEGDKSAFYKCRFVGLQDTLWDVRGRHYFKFCTIMGAVDFIFGAGQSLYERCTISVAAGSLRNGGPGYITAQARSHPNQTNGFVFKDCHITGNGKTYLGRPWREYARVVFYNTTMSDIIVPQGWDAWDNTGAEYKLTFVEHNCRGSGSNPSKRVKWAKELSDGELQQLTSNSFIDDEGWTIRQAFNMLVY